MRIAMKALTKWIVTYLTLGIAIFGAETPAINHEGTLADKTLVAWVALDDPEQRGAGVIALERGLDVFSTRHDLTPSFFDPANTLFDALAIGEVELGRWMASSDLLRRTAPLRLQRKWPKETASGEFHQIAVAYEGCSVRIYRDAVLYAEYKNAAAAPLFDARSSMVLLGRRYADGSETGLRGMVDEARIYARPLAVSELAALKPNTAAGPMPWACWNFEDGRIHDQAGRWPEGELFNGAEIRDGKLFLRRHGAFAGINVAPISRTASDKTLVAWIKPSTLDQRGGGVMTVERPGSHFDSITFGEKQPRRWMAGSEMWHRTQQDQQGLAVETGSAEWIQIAAVYAGRNVRLYRNGTVYADYFTSESMAYSGADTVMFGKRVWHGRGGLFAGEMAEARLYAQALSESEIRGLSLGNASGPVPWGRWTFERGRIEDVMHHFPEGGLFGGARIGNGNLILDGESGFAIVNPPADAAAPTSETLPGWHLTATRDEGFGNAYAPMGAIRWHGRQHLFYLHQEQIFGHGGYCWGHASSANLIDWTRHRPAIVSRPGDADMAVGPGNLFLDRNGVPTMSWYAPGTGICVAQSSDDNLETWRRNPSNPVLPIADCSGAAIWFDHDSDTYELLLAGIDNKSERPTCYRSKDLIHWEPAEGSAEQALGTGAAVDDLLWPQATGVAGKWALLAASRTTGAQIDMLDADRTKAIALDGSGGATFSATAQSEGKDGALIWNWLADPRRRESMRRTGNGVIGLPRSIAFDAKGELRQEPAAELRGLREGMKQFGEMQVKNAVQPLEGFFDNSCELNVDIDPGQADEMGLDVLCSSRTQERTRVGYDRRQGLVFIGLTSTSRRTDLAYPDQPLRNYMLAANGGGSTKRVTAPLALEPGERLQLRVFLDRSVVEVFANQRLYLSQQVFPSDSSGAQGAQLYASGGAASFHQIEAWHLRAAKMARANAAPEYYHPLGMHMWDNWYLPEKGVTHLYHLQVGDGGTARPPEDQGSIGHATSSDLLRWEEQPVALRKGPDGAYDGFYALFTGSAYQFGGTTYLYYTGLQDFKGRINQALCLATSRDGKMFERYAKNPLYDPDPALYYSIHDPVPPFKYHAGPNIDCRDMLVIDDPAGKGWLGYVAMRRKGQSNGMDSACISLYRSDDLIHWKMGPPVCTPNRYECFEVPDVFCQDGAWYMVALTTDKFGHSERWQQKDLTQGEVVFKAARPEGPFIEIPNDLLIASIGEQGLSARTVLRGNERLMLFARPSNGYVRLGWPVKLITTKTGALKSVYWPGIEKEFGAPQTLTDFGVRVDKPVEPFERARHDAAYMIRAVVRFPNTGRLGFQLGLGDGWTSRSANTVWVTPNSAGRNGCVTLTDPRGEAFEWRDWNIEPTAEHALRILVVNGYVDVYCDEDLVLNAFMPQFDPGRIVLCTDAPEIGIRQFTYWPARSVDGGPIDEIK